jgi:hypothetical protein
VLLLFIFPFLIVFILVKRVSLLCKFSSVKSSGECTKLKRSDWSRWQVNIKINKEKRERERERERERRKERNLTIQTDRKNIRKKCQKTTEEREQREKHKKKLAELDILSRSWYCLLHLLIVIKLIPLFTHSFYSHSHRVHFQNNFDWFHWNDAL